MKKVTLGMVVLCFAFFMGSLFAQEVSFRNGTITEISQIEVPASSAAGNSGGDSATKRAGMRSIGRALNRGIARVSSRVGGEYAADVYDVGSGVAQDTLEGVANNSRGQGERMVKAYLVVVRFDSGGESGIQAQSVNGLRVGQKVRVMGSGSSARISPR